MEIKNYLKGLDPYQTKLEKAENEKGKNARRTNSESSAAGDKVSLSNEAKLRTEAYLEANRAPEVRQEKVDALKAKIEAGEYTIDSRHIAQRLLEEQDLFT